MEKVVWKQNENELKSREFNNFVNEQDVDTDCIEDDVAIFADEQESNLYDVLGGGDRGIDVVRDLLRRQRILSKSFATGYHLLYWEWYRKRPLEAVKENFLFTFIDLGGYNFQDLSVYPRFGSLKDEILATGLLSPIDFEKLVNKKAKGYFKSSKCRKMKSAPFGGNLGEDPLHFEIKNGSPLTMQHLQSIILYTDFTELCTLFSLSLRKNKFGDGLKEIKARNSSFFYFSKFLRELVTYFGSNGAGGMNGKVSGSFFSGVSVILNISQFSIGFNCPTSTSMSVEIAWRFAGEEGMVLTVSNTDFAPSMQPVFNATWISAFAEEDEYLFFGSFFKVKLANIAIVSSCRVYKQSLVALSFFDGILSGTGDGNAKLKPSDSLILEFCVKNALKEPLPSKPKEVDQFVLDNVFAFCQNKTKIVLISGSLNMFEDSLLNLLFFGVCVGRTVPTNKDNIFTPNLFKLFPCLTTLELWTNGGGCYPLNLELLLNVLEDCETQNVFQLKLNDEDRKWTKKAFLAIPNIKELYAAKNWLIEFETMDNGEGGKDDWIFIKKM